MSKKANEFFGMKKKEFIKEIRPVLEAIFDQIADAPSLSFGELEDKNTVLLVVDMVNGFVKEGALASANVLAINEPVAAFAKACAEKNIPIAALCDAHDENSPEFESYPPHCVAGTVESDVTDEIKQACEFKRIEKGSVNGMLEPEFAQWLDETKAENIIIVGDCTDLCILQLANSIKAWFNRINRTSRVIVPTQLVSTYELGTHNAALTSLMALYNMSLNGVDVRSKIEF